MNKSKKGMYGALAFDLAGAGYATAVLCLDAASPYIAVPCAAICLGCAVGTVRMIVREARFEREMEEIFYQWREESILEYRKLMMERQKKPSPKRGRGRVAHLAETHRKARVRKKNKRRMRDGKIY